MVSTQEAGYGRGLPAGGVAQVRGVRGHEEGPRLPEDVLEGLDDGDGTAADPAAGG